MKDINIFIRLGIVVYVIMTIVDHFVHHLTDSIYIPLALLAIALILIGFCKSRK